VQGTPSPDTVAAPVRILGLEQAVRWALAAGVAFQVFQRFAKTGYELSEYGRSLWYVSYQEGFVRRGLAGEAVHSLLGHVPSLGAVDLTQNVVALVMLGAMTWFVVLLCRLRTVAGYAAAALIVVAPCCFDMVGGQRRPDLFGYATLVAVGAWAATRRPHSTTLGLVAGALLGISAFVSEASPLVLGPWLVLVVLAVARVQSRSVVERQIALTCTIVPSLVAFVALTLSGRASPETVVALESSAPPQARGHGSVFAYLTDTVGSSFERVVHGPGNPILSVLVGLAFGSLLLYCARGCRPYALAWFRWTLPTRAARTAWLLATTAAASVLFALGFDWLRWIASIGFAALFAGGALVLLDGRSGVGPPGREAWQRRLPDELAVTLRGVATVAAATYLLVLAPLPNFIKNLGDAGQTLLSVPR
jgi:hypothetical protein